MKASDHRSEFPSLTHEQTAERLGIHPATLHRWIKDGQAPPHFKVGQRRLWREADLLTWLETECRAAAGAG